MTEQMPIATDLIGEPIILLQDFNRTDAKPHVAATGFVRIAWFERQSQTLVVGIAAASRSFYRSPGLGIGMVQVVRVPIVSIGAVNAFGLDDLSILPVPRYLLERHAPTMWCASCGFQRVEWGRLGSGWDRRHGSGCENHNSIQLDIKSDYDDAAVTRFTAEVVEPR